MVQFAYLICQKYFKILKKKYSKILALFEIFFSKSYTVYCFKILKFEDVFTKKEFHNFFSRKFIIKKKKLKCVMKFGKSIPITSYLPKFHIPKGAKQQQKWWSLVGWRGVCMKFLKIWKRKKREVEGTGVVSRTNEEKSSSSIGKLRSLSGLRNWQKSCNGGFMAGCEILLLGSKTKLVGSLVLLCFGCVMWLLFF